eukprot:8143874-Pyramimonas_sp.AAC.1
MYTRMHCARAIHARRCNALPSGGWRLAGRRPPITFHRPSPAPLPPLGVERNKESANTRTRHNTPWEL